MLRRVHARSADDQRPDAYPAQVPALRPSVVSQEPSHAGELRILQQPILVPAPAEAQEEGYRLSFLAAALSMASSTMA